MEYSSSYYYYYSYLIIIIRIIFMIIFFLGSSFSQSSTMENGYDYYCANDYHYTSHGYISCGDSIIGLQYPFWSMDGKEEQQQQYYCGYPGFGITCNNGKPMINISNQTYYVTHFTGYQNSMKIVQTDFVDDEICPRPQRNFTTDQNFSSFHSVILREDYNFYLTIFFNCTSPPPLSENYYKRPHDLECLAYNNTMRSYGFLDLVEDTSGGKLLAGWNWNYCKEQSVVVPVAITDGAVTARDYLDSNSFPVKNTSDDINYFIFLDRGFRVGWETPIKCQRCESSGGFCLYNETESTYTCSCRKGKLIRQDAHSKHYYCYHQPNVTLSADVLRADELRAADASSMHNKTLIIGVSSGFGGLALIMILLFFIYRNKQNKRMGSIAKNVEIFLESYGYRSLQRYNYKDIMKMTNSFKDKLGKGGYGSVFKGKLVDGRPVAVKVLINDPKKKTNGEDFMNEVATIGRTNHVNIVDLLGFCSSGSKRALVYEFMTNGSLDKFIYAEKEKNITTSTSSNEVHVHPLGLGWEKLYQIAIGIAKGLEYLHRGCNTGRILHFDIKPHNILLDENFCPKISDFGLAKLCPTRESIVSMLSGGRGTIGYIAPEVYNRNFGGVSYKSDVYSYGMMVLEMVGGRKNIDTCVENTSEIYFPYWIYNHLEKDRDKIEGLLKFEEASDEEMAKKMIMVGLWCIQTHQECRPSMGRVADMLEGSLKDLQMPPSPFGDPSLHPPPTYEV